MLVVLNTTVAQACDVFKIQHRYGFSRTIYRVFEFYQRITIHRDFQFLQRINPSVMKNEKNDEMNQIPSCPSLRIWSISLLVSAVSYGVLGGVCNPSCSEVEEVMRVPLPVCLCPPPCVTFTGLACCATPESRLLCELRAPSDKTVLSSYLKQDLRKIIRGGVDYRNTPTSQTCIASKSRITFYTTFTRTFCATV